MVIPPLVVVAALQIAGPGDGIRTDAQVPSWTEVPAVVQTVAAGEISGPPLFQTPSAPLPGTENGRKGGNNAPSPMGSPLSSPKDSNAVKVAQIPPSLPSGLSGGLETPEMSDSTSLPRQLPPSLYGDSELGNLGLGDGNPSISGTTEVYDDRIVIKKAQVKEDYAPIIGSPVIGMVTGLRTPRCDNSGKIMLASDGQPTWIDIRRGTIVHKNQIVCEIDDRIPQAQMSVAKANMEVALREAEKDIEVEYAKAVLETQRALYKVSENANAQAQGAVTFAEMRSLWTQCEQARLQVKKAEYDLATQKIRVGIQQAEVDAAETQIDLRRIKSPITGVVVDMKTEVGSSLRETDPIMRIIELDKLKVVGKIDYTKVDQKMVDQKKVTVTAKSVDGRTESFEGFVRYASPLIESGRQFDIEVEVNNRREGDYWLLSPGKTVELIIHR